MNKWIELLFGLILVIVPILLASLVWPSWWVASWAVFKGAVFWGLVCLGALFILLGISDLKS